MNQTDYETLCRDTCVALRLDNPDQLKDEGQVTVDGIEMAVHFDEADDPDTIFCYVDLGLPVAEHRGVVLEKLLQLNLLYGSRTSGIYALHAESGHAVSCLQLNNADILDGDFVAEMLHFYAEETASVRAMVADPQIDVASAPAQSTELGSLFAGLV